MKRNLTTIVVAFLALLAMTTATSPPARAEHPTWLDPCMRFFHDPQRPWDLDVQERVQRFLADGMKTDAYDVPTPKEAQVLRDAFDAARKGKLDDAWRSNNCQDLKKLHYAVRIHKDTRSGRLVTVMWEFGERRDSGGSTKYYQHHGWGLFMIGHPSSSSNLLVEVPHACPPGSCPLGDLGTALVGAEAFSADNARYLLINGTPRHVGSRATAGECDDSNAPPRCPADVAHNERDLTIFHELHKMAITDPAVATVYQPHGFKSDVNRCGNTGNQRCDVVVSSGTGKATPQSTKVTGALRSLGLAVCHFGVNAQCVYGATKNAQQNDIESNRPGKSFLNVEVRRPINTGQEKDRFLLARTVAKALTE